MLKKEEEMLSAVKERQLKVLGTFKSEVAEFFVVVFFGDLYAVSLSCEFSFFVNSCDGTYLPAIIFFSAEIIPQRIFLFFSRQWMKTLRFTALVIIVEIIPWKSSVVLKICTISSLGCIRSILLHHQVAMILYFSIIKY
jgi:hypothetical protein